MVNRLGSLPRNSVIRWNGQLDMTLVHVVDWVVKPQYKQEQKQKQKNNEESDQTGQMLRLILFFARRTNHYVPANFCFPLTIINTFHSSEKPQITFIQKDMAMV